MEIETTRALAQRQGGLAEAFDTVVTVQKKAFVGHLKCMYFLAKQEIAHTTNFTPLVNLCKSLGATYLGDIATGGNAKYTSERFMQEIVKALGETILESTLQNIQLSPAFSLLIDETTDVSIKKQLIVYCKYLCNGEAKTSFLGILELQDGKAATITKAILDFCRLVNLDVSTNLFALGSDGASVMLGRRGGVSKLLTDHAPYLISNHCIAHRLALACGQAANEVPYFKKFKAILDQIYRFYQYSPVRTAGLHAIQEVLQDPCLKLSQAKDVRWLSHEKAVSTMRKCLPSVLSSLEREASERHDAQALGLASFVKDPYFVCSVYFLSDILPHLANLSKAFQRQNIDFSLLGPLLVGTKTAIKSLETTPGNHFQNLSSNIESLVEIGFKPLTAEKRAQFIKEVHDPYLSSIIDHLETRFPDVPLLESFSIFDPSVMKQKKPSELSAKVKILTDHYSPHKIVDAETTGTGYQCFHASVLSTPDLYGLVTQELMHKLTSNGQLQDMFPNLSKLAVIGLIVPMSTADCERGFSTLARVKNDLRNRLSCKILNPLMHIAIEGPEPEFFDYNRACALWSGWRNRRISV
jgi:hypothetical protein